MQQFDIAVIGGGLVGSSFVRAIAGLDLKVVLIDRVPANVFYKSDNRGLAISYPTAKILNKLNLWDILRADSYPIEAVHVSEQFSFGFTKLTAANYNLPALGYVISAANLGLALMQDLGIII